MDDVDEIRAEQKDIDWALHTSSWRGEAHERNHRGQLQCRASVHESYGVGFHQCTRRGIIEEGGYWWCKQHHPTTVKRRDEARRREWDRERAEEKRKREETDQRRRAENKVLDLAKKCLRQEASFDDLMDATAELVSLAPAPLERESRDGRRQEDHSRA